MHIFSRSSGHPVEKMITKSQYNMCSGHLSKSLHMNTCLPIRQWTRPSRGEDDKRQSTRLLMYFFMCWIIPEHFPEAAGWLGFPPREPPTYLSGWMIVCPFWGIFYFFIQSFASKAVTDTGKPECKSQVSRRWNHLSLVERCGQVILTLWREVRQPGNMLSGCQNLVNWGCSGFFGIYFTWHYARLHSAPLIPYH